MKENPNTNRMCPACDEPVKESWNICPACETSLKVLVCAACGMPVKVNWKRCPECEARLHCKACGRRIPPGCSDCPDCDTPDSAPVDSGNPIVEPVTGMEFVHVPAGTFMMGDTFDEGIENEKPTHQVRLDGFYVGKYPVFQAQWRCLMPDNPSRFKGDTLPVEQVSMDDVQRFIKKLMESSGGGFKFHLPAEAQWEYAARNCGREELYAGGDVADPVAWYDDNSNGTTHPVGTKTPNGLGIHDMSGNVWEWCQDTFRADSYQRHPPTNPVCSDRGEDWVIRGGSFNIDAWSVRCARRFSFCGAFSAPGLGFRLAAAL